MKQKPKILVILGPTATGKSGLAVRIAKKFSGEIISADSRQVYKGLDIGTGKITESEMDGIPHHLLDVIDPKNEFDVTQFKKLAEESIRYIVYNNKLPIIVGGTGFYIQSIVDGLVLPEVPPDQELRQKLERKSVEELLEQLEKLDPKRRIALVNQSNKRYIIRAIEVATVLGKVPELKKNPKYEVLQIGLDAGIEELKEKIHTRLIERIDLGMIEEGCRLEKEIGLDRMIQLGLEYKFLALFLKGELEKEEMIEKLEIAIGQYAKRQRTWFKRDKRINWFEPNESEKILALIQGFLN
jgi:tRNA dimethylallyltransferase